MSEPLCTVEDFLADVDVGTSSSSNSDSDSDSISCDSDNVGDGDGCSGAVMIMLGKANANTTDVNVSMPATAVDVPWRTMALVPASQVTLGGGEAVTADDTNNHAQNNLELKENNNKAQQAQAQQQSVRRELLRGSNWTTQSQPTSRADYDRSSGNNTIRYDCDQMAMHRALAGRTLNQIKMKWKKADNAADDSRSGGNGKYQYSDDCGHEDNTLKVASASAPGGAPRQKSAQPQAQSEQAHEHEPASRKELTEESEVVQAHPKKLAVAPKKRERGANWTREEEHTLLQLQKHNDNDWDNFAKHPTLLMGRRTAGQIETKWRGITRKGVNLHYLTKHAQYRNKGTCKGTGKSKGVLVAASKGKDGEQEETTETVNQKRHRSPAWTEEEQQALSKDKDGEQEEATVKQKRHRSPAWTAEEQQALSKDKDGEQEEAEATVNRKRHRSPVWTEEEKQALLSLQRSLCRNEWEAIATHPDLASRTACQIKAKWNHAYEKQPWRRGRGLNWTKEEEQALLDLDISEHNVHRTGRSGTDDHWEDIAKFPALAGRRTALEVKEKYYKMKLLGPNIHGIRSKNWTPEEDARILELYERTSRSSSSSAKSVCYKFFLVSEALSGRTPAAVQIRFYTLRKKAKAQAAKRSVRTLAC
jgi:hypothetical protein